MTIPLVVLYGLAEQILFFLIAWLASPATSYLCIAGFERLRPRWSRRRVLFLSGVSVGAFNVAFGLALRVSEPLYQTPEATVLLSMLPLPFSIGLAAFARPRVS